MALQESVRNLNKAYGRFFKKEAGYPRFKSRRGEQSSYHCTGVSAGDDFVKVPKMKKIKAVMHRKIEGKVKSITLSMDACGDYWASVLYEDGLPEAVPATCVRQTKTVGVDVGIETFGTCSDGEKIKSPKALKSAEKKLKEALQKPLLPSRMEQKCSVQFFLTTPGGAVFFTNIIVKYYYDNIRNLVVLWKSCSMAN